MTLVVSAWSAFTAVVLLLTTDALAATLSLLLFLFGWKLRD